QRVVALFMARFFFIIRLFVYLHLFIRSFVCFPLQPTPLRRRQSQSRKICRRFSRARATRLFSPTDRPARRRPRPRPRRPPLRALSLWSTATFRAECVFFLLCLCVFSPLLSRV